MAHNNSWNSHSILLCHFDENELIVNVIVIDFNLITINQSMYMLGMRLYLELKRNRKMQTLIATFPFRMIYSWIDHFLSNHGNWKLKYKGKKRIDFNTAHIEEMKSHSLIIDVAFDTFWERQPFFTSSICATFIRINSSTSYVVVVLSSWREIHNIGWMISIQWSFSMVM